MIEDNQGEKCAPALGPSILGRRHRAACMRAAVVAAIVGTALNLINQGEAILGGGSVVIWKVALTYLVPFIVSTHGALTASGGR